ncbi:hypothetical protein EJB05_43049, partial [Eragrostis curvula]
MEFPGRGQAAAAADDDRRFAADPPSHAGDSMLVIRDALLSQLQKDRLRQEIIVAELAKIERAIALRSAASPHGTASFSADPERANQAPVHFALGQQFVPHGRGAVDPEQCEHHVGAGESRDVKKEDRVNGRVQIKSEKPDIEDEPVRECFKTSGSYGKAPDKEKEASDKCDSDQAVLHKRASPAVHFAFDEQFMPHCRGPIGAEQQVCADEARDVKKKDEMHGVVQIKSEKPDMEDHLVRECSKTSGSDGMDPDQEKVASDDECKQESMETMLPKKTSPSVKWSCAICHVETTSEGNLLQHFAGLKHLANVIALKSKARAEKLRKARQYAEKPHPTWVCKFCPANCTGKSVLESHLKGKKHHAKIQALLEECKSMARDCALREADSNPNMEQQEEEKPDSVLICGLCQVKCTCPSVTESHVRGKKHQMNFQALKMEAKRLGIIPPNIPKKQQAPPEAWDCNICQAKCNSDSQFQVHCRSMGHQQELDALHRDGTNAHSSRLETGSKLTADGSNSNSASLEGEIQKALHFCKLCNLQCNSKNTLAEHRQGKKHLEKVQKRMESSFCDICNLQCNSEKMLAHHCTGSKHQANLKGC